jgi:hypothetical protein
VEQWRDTRYRRRPELRLRTSQQALGFVNDVGFGLLFPARDVQAPNLWEAVCGDSRPLPLHLDDPELGDTWRWKDELPSSGSVYYGKLVRKKPTLVSLDLLPCFYALSANYGDIEDYLIEYQDGKLSEEAKRVYEALLANGPLPTSHLRRKAGLEGKRNVPRFDRAIRDLQLGLKIVKTGVSDANRWGYCYVYDVLLRRWPDLAQRAALIPGREAQRRLVLTYLKNMGAARAEDVARLFAWEPRELVGLCEEWAGRGDLLLTRDIVGMEGDYLLWPDVQNTAGPRATGVV